MSRPACLNLSPGLDRVGRACAWIEREDGFVLMTGLEWGGWTLPGGGIHPGETPQQAAVREAWEEAEAHAEAAGGVAGEAVMLPGDSGCVPLRLKHLEPSPEGRPVAWVNPRSLPWADDLQIREVLAARGETPPHLEVPALVWLAQEQAARLAFRDSCSPETGRLLRTLAASRPGGRVLELGAGTGVSAAWLLAGLDRAARLLTVEADPARAEAAWAVLQADPRARVQPGDWTDALREGPFDLIFADCAAAKTDPDALARALKPGGTLIMDNFSPPAFMSPDRHAGDPLRDALFTHPQLTCTELEVRRRERVLLAVRTR
ncbi:class I SAM-dependent methyltransferase [Deinococcus aquaticus]|uniref:class I SAM-dependent methyltransferase n=1 Tax=Deinococcus aquaticus TaxID=328692 RepID=UPI003F47D4DC